MGAESSPIPVRRSLVIRAGAWLAVFATALVIALLVIRPWSGFAVGSDTAATVVYWDRILSGLRLEAFVGTTPKPWLSLVDGSLFGLVHDWRAVGVLAELVYAAGIASAALLVLRLTDSLAGAAFVAVGLIASWQLFQDVSLAYGVSWLLLACALAGLAAARPVPRYGLAGLFLCVGALARQEVLFVTGLAVAAVLIAELRRRRGEQIHVPPRAWLLALGLLAVPISLFHDWLLTGDPTYSLQVQAIGVAGRATLGLRGTIDLVVRHFESAGPLVLLALIGLLLVVMHRQWILAIGIVGLGPLVVLLVLFVGWRHLIVLERYLLPVDIAIVVAAGVTIAAISAGLTIALRPWLTARGLVRLGSVVGVALAVIAALVLSPRIGPLDASLRARLDLERQAVDDLAALRPALDAAIDGRPGAFDRPAAPHPLDRPVDRAILQVPARFAPTIAAETGLPLDRITSLDPRLVGTDGSNPRPGWVVLQQRGLTEPQPPLAFLEAPNRTTVGRLTIDPIASVDGRAWLDLIGSAP